MKPSSSPFSQTQNECRSSQENNSRGSEVRASVYQPSDDSDSEEIFRVKRRSSIKVERRTVNDFFVSSKNFEHQVSCTDL